MITKLNLVLICVVLMIVSLNSCARGRSIVIGAPVNADYLTMAHLKIEFPSDTEVSLVAMKGAVWRLSGNVASLAQEALDSLADESKHGSILQRDGEFRITDVIIRYSDVRPDGATSYPQIALEMSVTDITTDLTCEIGPITDEIEHPVNHGLFSSDEKKKGMLLPVYEEIIVERFTIAFEQALICFNKSYDGGIQ